VRVINFRIIIIIIHDRANVLCGAVDVTGKKHLALTVVACFSSARFGVKRTPSTRTVSETFTVFVPSVRDRSWTRRRLATLYFVPAHISSVFSAFSFSRMADIQQLIAVTHCSSAFTDDNILLRSQCTCSWLSSAKACSLTPNVEASSARSAVYRINNSGPRTEPCGTEHVTWMTDDVFPPCMTHCDLPVR